MKVSEILDYLLPLVTGVAGYLGSNLQRHIFERRKSRAESSIAEVGAQQSLADFNQQLQQMKQETIEQAFQTIRQREEEILKMFTKNFALKKQLAKHREELKEQVLSLVLTQEGGEEKIFPLFVGTNHWEIFIEGMYTMPVAWDEYTHGTVIKCKTEKPVEMHKHSHPQAEGILLLSGEMIEKISGKVLRPNEYMFFPPGQPHHPVYTKPSNSIIFWTPPLDPLVK